MWLNKVRNVGVVINLVSFFPFVTKAHTNIAYDLLCAYKKINKNIFKIVSLILVIYNMFSFLICCGFKIPHDLLRTPISTVFIQFLLAFVNFHVSARQNAISFII